MSDAIREPRDPLLRADNVTMQFGGLTALNGVDFSIHTGEILGLIGPNGAGKIKTTCFNVMTGVYQPTLGQVVLAGRALGTMQRHKITKLGIAVPSRTSASSPR